MDPGDPTDAALRCADAFERAGLRCAVVGGLALAAYGEPRETVDVDLAVVDVSAARARDALAAAGVACAAAFDGVVFGGLRLGRVTLLGREDAPGVHVLDLVTPRSPRLAQAVLDRSVEGDLRGRSLRVVTAEDFVVLKCLSTRDKDLDDAASVLRNLSSELDVAEIDGEVTALASELPDVDVAARWRTVRERAQS